MSECVNPKNILSTYCSECYYRNFPVCDDPCRQCKITIDQDTGRPSDEPPTEWDVYL